MWRLLVILAVFSRADGYGRGAPDTACQSMFPRHGPNPQNTPAPYSITPLQAVVEPGGTVTIRLEAAQGTTFRGFLLQALSPAGNLPGPLGSFVNPPSSVRLLTCSPGLQNALTHADAKGKTSLDVQWDAPRDYQGDVQFRATFVRDYSTFWVQVPSSTLVRVGRAAAPNPTAPPNFQLPTTYNPPSTTTATTTTTRIVSSSTAANTNSWSFTTPPPAPTSGASLASVYTGCGDLKGCFGLSDPSCVQSGTCTALVTYALKGTRYEFELWAPNAQPNSYVAVGLSDDNKMGDDSVTECTLVNGRINVYMSYNDGKSNTRLRDPAIGLSQVEARYSDGNLYCRFSRQSPFTVNGRSFDLGQPQFLLLARGPASESGITYHDRQKGVTVRSVNLAETLAVGASRGTLVKLHGAFMVAAWMFAASLGILFARYFRLTWVGRQFMGKDLWFVFHRILMTAAWALTMVAVVLIFVELGGWTSVPATTNPHAVIGIITTVLAFIQPIMAYFRPHPGTPKRFIFNWAHWSVGNSAHILAIVCIFLAVDLDKASIPYWVNWLLVTYVAIHASTHLLLSLAQCCYHADGSRKSSVFAMRDLAPHQTNQNNFYSTQQQQDNKKEDAHGSVLRRAVLAVYIVLVACFAAAVIGVIVTGPWSKR